MKQKDEAEEEVFKHHFLFILHPSASSLNFSSSFPPCTESARGQLVPLAHFRQDSPSMSERPVVLIADDNDDVVMLLRTYLKPLECEFLIALDGEEALTVAQSRLPDVVLLDV